MSFRYKEENSERCLLQKKGIKEKSEEVNNQGYDLDYGSIRIGNLDLEKLRKRDIKNWTLSRCGSRESAWMEFRTNEGILYWAT